MSEENPEGLDDKAQALRLIAHDFSLRASKCFVEDVYDLGYAAAQAENTRLREALRAVMLMAQTAKPTKLDAALTWRQNDGKAHAMAIAALERTP